MEEKGRLIAFEKAFLPKNETAETIDPLEKILTEWATKIYRAADEIYKESVALCSFKTKEQSENFRETMCQKYFGRYIKLMKSPHFLYLKICDHAMDIDYHPCRYHIEEIKKILASQNDWLEAANQIMLQIQSVIPIAEIVRRNILYPEIIEMEKKMKQLNEDLIVQKVKNEYMEDLDRIAKKGNAKLQEELKEERNRLRTSLDMWAFLSSEINSALMRGTDLVYALRVYIGTKSIPERKNDEK